MEASPIVTSRQREEVVHGVRTEVVCTAFSNSVLVVVTQYGKMGTIVYVDPNTIGDNVGRPSLTTKVLLGKDEVFYTWCVRTVYVAPFWGLGIAKIAEQFIQSVSVERRLLSNKFSNENCTFNIRNLAMIETEPLVHVCAKHLVAFVSQEAGNKPVLLAMALKDKTMEGIQALREVIRSCQVW